MVSSIHSYTDLLYDDSLTSLKYATFHSYLTVDEAQDTKYFYWFAECDGCDAATAPVALWTNGGPGCSGLLGFMTEQGPLRPNGDGTLAQNPYAWNKAANYLFVEQPVGVGFSYSTTPDAYRNVGDDQAAALNYQLILSFSPSSPSTPLTTSTFRRSRTAATTCLLWRNTLLKTTLRARRSTFRCPSLLIYFFIVLPAFKTSDFACRLILVWPSLSLEACF